MMYAAAAAIMTIRIIFCAILSVFIVRRVSLPDGR